MSTEEWECEYEYEYEYSPDETESLYFTLDLTTHVPDALTDQPIHTSNQPSQTPGAPNPEPSSPHSNSSSGEDEREGRENDEQTTTQESLPTLQILDLHTSKPLIKFDQSIYTTYWTTDLGTQFHIAQTGQTRDPLRKGTILDVLGISRARLLGKPVQLIDRNAPPLQTISNGKAALEIKNHDDEEEEYNQDENSLVLTTGPLKIPRTILKTAKSKSQASFLERLSEIKLRKGERDQVPILAVKHYSKPANAEDIKRKAEDDDRNGALLASDGKKRRRKRPMGIKARNKGGAGRPSRGDIEGMLGFRSREIVLPGEGEGQEEEEEDEEEEQEEPVGVGMFEPGGRGEMREEVVNYLEHPSRVQSWRGGGVEGEGEVGIDDGRQLRHPGTPAMEFPSPAPKPQSERGETSSSTYENQQGYLSFQTRAEYLTSVRAEAILKGPPTPMRPPWMEGGDVEEQQQRQQEGDGQNHRSYAGDEE